MLGGKINDSFSCGSLLMEYRLKDDLICNALEPIDILFVGLNLIRGCTPQKKYQKFITNKCSGL